MIKKKRNLKLEVVGYFLNLRAIYVKPIANILLNGERQSLFPKIRNETRCLLLSLLFNKGFTGGSMIKNLPAKQEMWVQSLGQEDPLEKEMQPTPVFLPGKSHEVM